MWKVERFSKVRFEANGKYREHLAGSFGHVSLGLRKLKAGVASCSTEVIALPSTPVTGKKPWAS